MAMQPVDAAASLTMLTTLKEEVESSPEVGSSRNRMRGEAMSSTPMAARLRSPPDTPLQEEGDMGRGLA